ncbi:hypothetical protein E2320_006296 [Naja naja]|nr:hypothetical protein E2320_006296 [Naja naja]
MDLGENKHCIKNSPRDLSTSVVRRVFGRVWTCQGKRKGQGNGKRVEGVQPVTHVFVVQGLEEDAAVSGADGKDEDVRAAHHHKMFGPRRGERLLEVKVAFLGDHGPGSRAQHVNRPSGQGV